MDPSWLEGRGATVWLTGRSGAGKTTLALTVAQLVRRLGGRPVRIDGDDVRSGLSSDLGFSTIDRRENVRRIGHVAVLLATQGLCPVVSCISPIRDARRAVEELHATAGVPFLEIYLDVSVETCARRDPKGLYAAGVLSLRSDDFEPPLPKDGAVVLPAAALPASIAAVDNAVREFLEPLVSVP